MKMQYSRKRNALLSTRTLLVGSGVFLVCLFALMLGSVFPSLPIILSTPGWKLGAAATEATHSVTSIFVKADKAQTSVESLQSENQVLQNENRALRAHLSDISHLTASSTLPTHQVIAGVLSRPPLSPYDTLVLALPDGTSVKVGARVYGPGSVPIGTISETGHGSARVLLYSSPKSTVDGWIGEKRLPVILTGESAGSFSSTLSHESGVLVGDVLYLPGPGALPVGTVARISSDPSSTNDIVYIVPYVNIFSLTWVAIETTYE